MFDKFLFSLLKTISRVYRFQGQFLTYEIGESRATYYEYKGPRGRHVVRTTLNMTLDSMEDLLTALRSGQLKPVKTEVIGQALPEPDWNTLLENVTVV